MTRPTRQHGTRSCYVSGCRREECRAASREYGRNYWLQYRRPLEGSPHVPAERAAQHVAELRAAGMGKREIARAAGVRFETVRAIATRRLGVRPETERKLLAVQLNTYLRPATGPQRRVRALARIGWTRAAIAVAAGLTEHTVGDVAAGAVLSVTRQTETAVRRAYDALSMTPGPSVHNRSRAASKGWAPPLAWDDDTIDDPEAMPDFGGRDQMVVDDAVIERVLAGESLPTNAAEREVLVPRLAARGLNDHDIAALCGVWAETVLRTRRRLGVESRWVA